MPNIVLLESVHSNVHKNLYLLHLSKQVFSLASICLVLYGYFYRQILRQQSYLILKDFSPALSVLNSGLKREWQPILTPQKITYQSFLGRTLQYLKKKNCPPQVEKTTLKSSSEKLKSTLFPYCPELPKRPKKKNSCSKKWLIDQLWDFSRLKLINIILLESFCAP